MTRIILKTLNEIKFWKLFKEKPEWTEKELIAIMKAPNYIFAIYKLQKLEEKLQKKLVTFQKEIIKLNCDFHLEEIYTKVWGLKING